MNLDKLKEEIKSKWVQELLGTCENIQVEVLKEGKESSIEEYDKAISLLIANVSAAISTRMKLGTAREDNLKEVKSNMDTNAGFAFVKHLRQIMY